MPATCNHHPLLVTADDRILDDVLRVAAANGVDVSVEPDAGAARRRWPAAPVVLVGDDQIGAFLQVKPARRSGVVVVRADDTDDVIWRQAVALGAEQVLSVRDDEQALAELLADIAEGADGDAAVVVGCVGGCGGAGASVLAAALALTGTRCGSSTMLIDADPYGGGIDLVLGAESDRGLRWPDLSGTRGRVGGRALREHLPDSDGLTVLSWDRGDVLGVPPEASRAVIAAARRTSDLVVVDLPRQLGPGAEELAAACGVVLLVVPRQVRAIAASGRVVTALGSIAPDIRLVVRGPAPSGLTSREVVASLGLPLAAEIETDRGLAVALERGRPPIRSGRGQLAAACRTILSNLVASGEVAA